MQANHRKAAPRMERTKRPGVYRRGGRYVAVTKHRGRQQKSSHRTFAEACEAKARRESGERKPATRETFADYATDWLASYAGRTSRGFTDSGRDAYRRAIERYAVPFFRARRLADIEPPDVRAFVAHLESKGLAPGSVVKNLTPLRAMLATAHEDGALRDNPTRGVRVNGRRTDPLAESDAKVKAMTRAELARLLGTMPDEWRVFFELLAHTGLRISEALGLDWPDVEFGKRPMLRVRRQFYRGTLKTLKTHNGRRDVPLSTGMARKLWTAKPAAGAVAMFTTRNRTRYLDRNVRRVLDRATESAGVPWVTFHTFRHTCASMLFEGGKDIKQVSEWLGHADPAFTLRTYVHLMDGGLGDAEFLDTAVQVGNPWATRAPQTPANPNAPDLAKTALARATAV
jgi:integrase